MSAMQPKSSVPEHSTDLAPLLAEVRQAGSVIAPYWPVSSFVAVNPLGGLEHLPFEEATATARSLFTADTHLSLDDYRLEHAEGRITAADLLDAITKANPTGSGAAFQLGSATVTAAAITMFDLVNGPAATADSATTDPFTQTLNAYLSTWCATYVDSDTAAWSLPGKDDGFFGAWRDAVEDDRGFTRLFGKGAKAFVATVADQPLRALQQSLSHAMVAERDRAEVLRAMAVKLSGWAGYARWCDEWAPADHRGPSLKFLDVLAVRAVIEAAAVQIQLPDHSVPATAHDGSARVDAVIGALADGPATDSQRAAVAQLIQTLPDGARRHLWLQAHEHNFHDRLLGKLQRVDPGRPEAAPDAQMVMCIDVRSEGMRRNLEALGHYDTYGFAGFFGVPVRWRPLGSDLGEARCPVLVSPKHEIAEMPATGAAIGEVEGFLGRAAATGAAQRALHDTKKHLGAPFAFAEASGWLTGPLAAARTFMPGKGRKGQNRPDTAPAVDDRVSHGDGPSAPSLISGLSLQEQSLFAEAIVRTIGMHEFAPIVVLCGHASATVNNPHASSLDCGACGGAPGGPSARIASAILNEPDVRANLAANGVTIPDTTWFVAAEHDTVSDVVTVLDPQLIPTDHTDTIMRLQADLATAGVQNADDRAKRLPGNPADVRDRGSDWAQVRPEWGLAGNAAFVVGPRSITRDLDLASRVFLHSYDAGSDPDEVALETIMTAPLIVAQWISSQYYFSTVDNDVFGAGDKMIHNPVGGTVGVLRGEGGDLAVGLPLQSTSAGDRRGHDPLRLMAVIQAPLERIEAIIARNTGLRQLVEGEWMHIAGRSHGHEPWSIRTPAGTWETWQPAGDTPSHDISLELA